ncbi:MAG: HD domain-containing protein [Desulfobacteraceae bacterium]|nr:HD domain-containing protein [Desulfobacteraceae bacterium]
MVSSQRNGFGKVVVDSIHGNIPLNKREVQVIDTASFQRLRHLKQLAMAQLVYPTSTHTRFAHSIGALGTMIRILETVEKNGIHLPDEQKDNLRLAALLHDVGHYPYSHLMEKLDNVMLIEDEIEGAETAKKAIDAKKSKYPEHPEVGALIVTGQDDLVKALGDAENAKAVADIFTRAKAADPQLSKLIRSSFDIDRWDYLLRDSYATGVPYGQIDINYLLNNLKVSPQKVVGFKEKALAAVEHLLLSRFFMYRVVYCHKTIYGIEEACRQLLRRLRDRDGEHYNIPIDGESIKSLVASEKLHLFTDAFVDSIIQQAVNDEDKIIQALAKAIQNRRPPKLLREVLVCEETEKKYHAGKTFMRNCRTKLEDLAKKFNIPLKQFLLCGITLPVVKEPQKHTTAEITKFDQQKLRDMEHEEEEEDIKIFVGDEDEPKSLMEIEHSLVVKYASYSLQMFRLYVVYEGEDKDTVISQLREAVKDWDKA